ncbi:MAG: zinc-ribbon domain-containing protein [Bacilli bacterium]|jgi:hypothetical protein
MKYCSHCGAELLDDAVVCPKCGCAVNNATVKEATTESVKSEEDTLGMVAKVFLLISCICMGFCIIPLAWCIPITVSIWHSLDEKRPISVGTKVCALIFVSQIAGILLLCDDKC